jgi:hypothetical protein
MFVMSCILHVNHVSSSLGLLEEYAFLRWLSHFFTRLWRPALVQAPNWDPELSNPDAFPAAATVAHSLYTERLIRMPHSYMFASHAHIGAFANVVRSLRGLHRNAYAEGRAAAAARRLQCLDGAGSDGAGGNDKDGSHHGNVGQKNAADASRDTSSGNGDNAGASGSRHEVHSSGNHDEDDDDENHDYHLGHHRLRLAQLRRALSMPDRGVLLVAFAGSYKLPPMLPIWLRMLNKHANAVLILRAPPATNHQSSSSSSLSSSASDSADSNADSTDSNSLNTDQEKERANDAYLSRSARENILALAAAANVRCGRAAQ